MLYLHPLSKTPRHCLNDLVAQLVEHFTFNERVPGSSPGQVTKNNLKPRKLLVCGVFVFIAVE